MNNKRKVEHISYGITKNEANYQVSMVELMGKLLDQTRTNNYLLKRFIDTAEGKQSNIPGVNPSHSAQGMRNYQTGLIFYPNKPRIQPIGMRNLEPIQGLKQLKESSEKQDNFDISPKKIQQSNNPEPLEDDFKKLINTFQQGFVEVANANKKICQTLNDFLKQNKRSQRKSTEVRQKPEAQSQPFFNDHQKYQQAIIEVLDKRQKFEKKSYGHYGIISEVMPFSDKREIKVRYKIIDLMEQKDMTSGLNMQQFKQKTTEWVGMVFRATASICWNMLYGGQLNFEEVKVLFTENIIFNFIEYMKDIVSFINEEKKLQMTNHINYVSCEVLQFLCRQYPQTKVEAPNIALRKSIPIIENQGQSKFDLITMACRDSVDKQSEEQILFSVRDDKDYSSIIMKVINYMVDQTQDQYSFFQKTMTNIFEKIFLPKQKRIGMKGYSASHQGFQLLDSQYRQKVKSYSSYLIGRKIPKNTPKYTKNEIQYGVFFVKSPSILRIITKWFEQLWDFVNTPLEKLQVSTNQIKDHEGRVLNISTRVKHLLYQSVNARLGKIQSKIQRIKTECYNMELLLSDSKYTSDSKQIHLSQDQLSVGKYCSNLKNGISSYVCAQLSKVIYYLLLIPIEIDENVLDFNDQDFQQQARKHLDNTNLVTLKIFDLLRCKCHSNEEEIIYIVEALKQLENDDPKFEIVRVKDRLNQGTRDILINAQYDGGLVWQIQLAVTSNIDKKQDMLDKYNHFLYQLKRNKLGPISQCVSIWSSLEQRSLYFEQLIQKRKEKGTKCDIVHIGKSCKQAQQSFSEFKRPIICLGCKQYFAIPLTSLLNVRCQTCRITYCGLCFYASLSDLDKKKFMFQNFYKKKLFTNAAFNQLQQYTDVKKPFPKEGFYIKKKFLNRQLSYFTVTKVDKINETQDQYYIAVSQIIIRNGIIDIRAISKEQLKIVEKNGQFYLKTSEKDYAKYDYGWIFYFKNKKPEKISLNQLEEELRDVSKGKMKYLNVLFQPNYMTNLKLHSKIFEKVRLINNIKAAQDIEKYQISVYRFSHLTVLAKLDMDEQALKTLLVKKSNKSILKGFIEKKMTIVNMEQYDLSDQIDTMLSSNHEEINLYFSRVQKLYLADNNIENISCFNEFKALESLSISKNYLKSLNGVQELIKMHYLKFDENNITSLLEIKNLINLTYISGNINKIDSLAGIQGLVNLGSLSLCQNCILDVSQMKNLSHIKRVYMRDNPIKIIMALQQSRVRHLYIGNTLINPLEISKLECISILKELSLKNMKLILIPDIFQKATQLEELKLSKNNIQKIENIQKAVNLLFLDLSDNEITVMENLQKLQNLEVLRLKNNKIKVVEGVKTYIESIKVIHLQNNPLEDLSDYLIYEEKSAAQMRLKFTEQTISAKAKEQIKNHSIQIGNRSESDD